MKFRAKMNEALCMRQFSSIVTTLSRISKMCVLRLCSDKFYFIISEENSFPARTSAWCTLETSHFFIEYSLVGHPEQNEIFLEFSTDMLASSLSSVKGTSNSARCMKIKLTDKVSPCLTLEIELLNNRFEEIFLATNKFTKYHAVHFPNIAFFSYLLKIFYFLNSSCVYTSITEMGIFYPYYYPGQCQPSQMANSRLCVHDVPVSLIPRREWSEYQEPALCDYDMCIEMPSLKIVRNVVDKLKKLSHNLIITATSDNELTLKVETSQVTVATHFKDLIVEKIRGGQKSASVQVDIRRFSNFLTCDQINPTKVMCNILKGKLIHQYLEHSDLVLNYFLVGVDD